MRFIPIILTGDELQQRRDVCKVCEFLRPGPIDRCGACGCAITPKTRIKQSTCPKGKWPMLA
jgi:hypothetical protein